MRWQVQITKVDGDERGNVCVHSATPGNGLFANKARFRNDFPLLWGSVRSIALKLVDQRRKEKEERKGKSAKHMEASKRAGAQTPFSPLLFSSFSSSLSLSLPLHHRRRCQLVV